MWETNSRIDTNELEREQLVRELFLNPKQTLQLDYREPGHIFGRLANHPILSNELHRLWQYISETRFESLAVPGAVMMADEPERPDLWSPGHSTSPPPCSPPPPFKPWTECVAALTDAALERFAEWRGYSDKFCHWLCDQLLIGMYGNHFCLPIFGPGGAVIAEHVFTPENADRKSFTTGGAKGNMSPVVLGPLPHASCVFLSESPWDVFAVADRTGLYKSCCFVASRGATNDKMLAQLPWPKLESNQSPPVVFLLTQNDAKKGSDGLTANERWIRKVRALIPFSVYRVAPPQAIHDFNDWIRDGVSVEELTKHFGQVIEVCDPEPSSAQSSSNGESEPVYKLTGRNVFDLLDLEIDPSTNLLGNRWLTRDGSAFVIAPSGHGKSSFATQAAICWAIDRVVFGIKPARPLRILIVQSEDDDAESKKFVQLIRKMKLTANERELLRANTRFEYRRDLSGVQFIAALDAFLTEWPADMVIINPLTGFLLCDMKNDEKVTEFLRGQLNAVMLKYRCAVLVIHHMPKINFIKLDDMKWYDWMYTMSGCAALTNWTRAVLVIAPSKITGTYRLIAAKRFDEIQWTDREYWFSHSKETLKIDDKEYEIIEWVPSTEEQIASAKPTPKGRKERVTAQMIFEKMSPLEWYTKEEFQEWVGDQFGIGLVRSRDILRFLRDKELVQISEEKRSKTRPLKRFRKLNKPFNGDGLHST